MRNLLIIAGLLIFISPAVYCQKISESVRTMSNGAQNGFTTDLPTVDRKMALKVLENSLKEYKGKKMKYVRREDELFYDDVSVKGISKNTVDIYAKFGGTKDSVQTLTIWVDLGGAYLSTSRNSDSYSEVKDIFDQYHADLAVAMAEANVETQEKMLKTLEGDLKKLEKEKKDLEEAIERAEKTIVESKEKIELNEGLQETTKEEIERQTSRVDSAKDDLKNKKKKN